MRMPLTSWNWNCVSVVVWSVYIERKRRLKVNGQQGLSTPACQRGVMLCTVQYSVGLLRHAPEKALPEDALLRNKTRQNKLQFLPTDPLNTHADAHTRETGKGRNDDEQEEQALHRAGLLDLELTNEPPPPFPVVAHHGLLFQGRLEARGR